MTKRKRKPANKIHKYLHKAWVRVIILIIFIGTSAVLVESTKAGHLAIIGIGGLVAKTVDVVLDVVADRIFPMEQL